jgi:hypothetical protein
LRDETMKNKFLIALILGMALVATPALASVSFTDGISSAIFDLSGTTLTVDVSQTAYAGTVGGAGVADGNLLTAVFWYTPTAEFGSVTGGAGGAAVATGSSVIQWPSGQGTAPTDLGAEYAYKSNLAAALAGSNFPDANQGISNAGLGVFGSANQWVPNQSLNTFQAGDQSNQGPDGSDFIFVPASYSPGDGNPEVDGDILVQYEMLFTLTVPAGFNLNDIDHVGFNYGTALNPGGFVPIPIPPSAWLLGSGLLGLAGLGWRRRRQS